MKTKKVWTPPPSPQKINSWKPKRKNHPGNWNPENHLIFNQTSQKFLFRFQNVHFHQIHGPPTPACKAEHNTPRNQPIHRFGEASFLKTHPALGCFWGAWSVYGFPVVLGTFLCFLCFTFAVVLVGVFRPQIRTRYSKTKTLFIAGLGEWKINVKPWKCWKRRIPTRHCRETGWNDWLKMVHWSVNFFYWAQGSAVNVDAMRKPTNLKPPLNH